MLDLRQRIIVAILAVVGVIVVVAGGYMLFVRQKSPAPTPTIANEPTQTGTTNTDSTTPAATTPVSIFTPAAPTPTETKATPQEVIIKQTARFFVERFGSYSNQNQDGRLEEILPIATPVMAQWLRTQDISQGDVYSGVTTKVVTSKIASQSGAKASVTIGAQIEETTDGNTTVTYKTGRVELLQQGAEWKIDGFYWDK